MVEIPTQCRHFPTLRQFAIPNSRRRRYEAMSKPVRMPGAE